MAFDMKYDKNGMPISQPQPPIPHEPEMAQAAPEPIEQTVDNMETVEDNSEITRGETSQIEEPVQEAKVAQEFKVSQENQRNIRYMRERAEQADRLERERDDLARKLAESQAKPQQQEENYDLNLGDNDLAEGKHLSKVQKEIASLKKELSQYKQQTAQQVTESRIKAQFPDFDKIVSQQNIAQLQAQYPEIANTLNASTDLYSTAVSAYTMIKKLGIVQEQAYNPDKAQALKNLAKPKPLASLSPQQGDSPLSKANAFANGLTEDLKKQLAREMFEARNQI